jgi:hypothetical protein
VKKWSVDTYYFGQEIKSRVHCHTAKLGLNWRVSVNWVTLSVNLEEWKFGAVDSIVEYFTSVVISASECHIP